MRKCHYCGKAMPDEEIRCPSCWQYSDDMNLSDYTDRARPKTEEKSGIIVIAASFIIPGSGQFMKEQLIKAVFFLGAAVFFWLKLHWSYGLATAIASALDAAGSVYKCPHCSRQVPGSAKKCTNADCKIPLK